MGYLDVFFFFFFSKDPSFKIAMFGQSGERVGGRRPRLTFWLNFFSKLHVTFILQWVDFIFGRDKEEDQ